MFLHLKAVLLANLAEKYGCRPSAFVTFRRAFPEQIAQFDLAVTLWASAEQLMDQKWAKDHAPKT